MKTLLLDRTTWDLLLDASGNIAVATAPYQLAQDVASAVRLFAAELWYDTTRGVPYWNNILGKRPPIRFFKAQVEKAALSVPGVLAATCNLVSFTGRQLAGQIVITDATGKTQNVQF